MFKDRAAEPKLFWVRSLPQTDWRVHGPHIQGHLPIFHPPSPVCDPPSPLCHPSSPLCHPPPWSSSFCPSFSFSPSFPLFTSSSGSVLSVSPQVTECVAGKPALVLTWLGINPKLPAVGLNSHMDVVGLAWAIYIILVMIVIGRFLCFPNVGLTHPLTLTKTAREEFGLVDRKTWRVLGFFNLSACQELLT